MSDLNKYLTSEIFRNLIEDFQGQSDEMDIIAKIKEYDAESFEMVKAIYGKGVDEIRYLVEYMNSAECTEEDLKKIKNSILKLQGKEIEVQEAIKPSNIQKQAVIEQDQRYSSNYDEGYQSDASSNIASDNNTQETLKDIENSLDSLNDKYSSSEKTLDSLEGKLGELQVEFEKITTAVTEIDEEKFDERIEGVEKAFKLFRAEFKGLAKSAGDVEEASIGYKTFFVAVSIGLLAVAAIVCYRNGKNQEEINRLDNQIDLLMEKNPDLIIPDEILREKGSNGYYSNLARLCVEKAREGVDKFGVKFNRERDSEKEGLLDDESDDYSRSSEDRRLKTEKVFNQEEHKRGFLDAIRDAAKSVFITKNATVERKEGLKEVRDTGTSEGGVKLVNYKELGFDTRLDGSDYPKVLGRSTFFTSGHDIDHITIDGKEHEILQSDLLDRNSYENGKSQKLKSAISDTAMRLKRKFSSSLDSAENISKRAKTQGKTKDTRLLGDTDDDIDLESIAASEYQDIKVDLRILGESDIELKQVGDNIVGRNNHSSIVKDAVSSGFEDNFVDRRMNGRFTTDAGFKADFSASDSLIDSDIGSDCAVSAMKPLSTIYTRDRGQADELVESVETKLSKAEENGRLCMGSVAARVERGETPKVREFVSAFDGRAGVSTELTGEVNVQGISQGSVVTVI